jgi:hypothetical protein
MACVEGKCTDEACSDSCSASPQNLPAARHSSNQRPPWVSLVAALGCQGNFLLECLLSVPSLPAYRPVVFYGALPTAERPTCRVDQRPAAVFFSPPVPPPRVLG